MTHSSGQNKERLFLIKARNVVFRSLTESIDTAAPAGRAMWQMLGVLAEERSLNQRMHENRQGRGNPERGEDGTKV